MPIVKSRYRQKPTETINTIFTCNSKLSGDGRHVSISTKRHLQRSSHDQFNESYKPSKRSRTNENRPARPCSSSNNTTETSSSECSVRMTRVKPSEEKMSLSTPALRPLRRTSRVSGDLSGCDILSGSDSGDLINLEAGENEERLIDVEESDGINVMISKSFLSTSEGNSGMEADMFNLDVRKSSSWSSSVDRSMADLNSYSTICDSFLDEKPEMPNAKKTELKTKCKSVRETSEPNDENLVGSVDEHGENVLLDEKSEPLGELSMCDVLEFLTDTMEDVKLWIHEVPEDCRKRIGQCEAFLSYLCAKLYKDRDILVAPNIFSFILWNVLKEYGSPNEYDLSLLAEAFTTAKTQQKGLQWRHHSVADIAKDLPMTLSCQKKDCFEYASKSLCDLQQDKNAKNVKFKKRVSEKLNSDPRFQHLQVGQTVVQKLKANNRKPHLLDQNDTDARPDVFHSLSLESLSDALANTQPRKATAALPSQEHAVVHPNSTKTEEKLPTADEMTSFLSYEIPVKPSPSKLFRGKKEPVVEPQNYAEDGGQTPMSDACEILYKTAKRNLRRMVDFALTEFFTQSPSLTCCFVSAKGPLLVHEALFGAQCNNWGVIRRNGRKRAGMNGNHLIVDLRPDNIQHAGLWTVIEFVYTGSFTVTADNVFESQKAAEFFGIPSITDASLRLLNCLTSPKMLCYTIESLRRLQREKHPLWTLALGKLVVCFDECRNDKIMVRWPLEVVLPILEQSELYTKDEVNVYNFAVRWVEADFARRRALVPQIMNTVRFASMSGDTLLFISSHAKVLDGHPTLRQEIADLHLKVRMEDNGFDIPAEMDWSIPRRSKRSPNAARAYAQSGGDLNVLMLYFCPREFPESSKNEQFMKEDAAVILHRYTKICQNFLLVTDDGRFAGRWIYYGLTPLQMRDLATERRKLVRTADPFDRSSDIVGVGSDVETIDTVDTDSPSNNVHNLPVGTKLDNLMNYLRTPQLIKPKPRLSAVKLRPPTIYEERVAELAEPIKRKLNENGRLPENSQSAASLQPKIPPGLIGELRNQRSMSSADSADIAKIAAMKKELWSRISGTGCSAPVPCVPMSVREAVTKIEQKTKPQQGQLKLPEGSKSLVAKAESFITFVANQDENENDDMQENYVKRFSDDEEPASSEKKWYVELAEKMNVFATIPELNALNDVSPSASSIYLQTEDMESQIK